MDIKAINNIKYEVRLAGLVYYHYNSLSDTVTALHLQYRYVIT